MSIRSIELINFQSHKNTKFDLSDGINIIIGESSSGKTAIARAVRWLWYNKPKGVDFIRLGAKQAEVKVVLDNGCEVSRIRSDKVNRYSFTALNGAITNYDNFGDEIPKEIKDILGVSYFSEYDVDELNYAEQGASNALLHASGSVKSKLFNIFTGMDKLDVGLSSIRRDKLSINKEIKYIQEQKTKNDIRLEKYTEYNNKILLLIKDFDKEVETYKINQGCLNNLILIKNNLDSLDNATEVLNNRLKKIRDNSEYKFELDRLYNEFNLITEYAIIRNNYNSINRKSSILEKSIQEIEKLNNVIDLEEMKNNVDMSALLLGVSECDKSISTIHASISDINVNLVEARKGYTQILADLGVCPTCEQRIGG